MPNYKVVNSDQLDADLTTVADAIRAKAGVSGKLEFPSGMADAVRNIQSGVEIPELSNPGTASDLAKGKQLIGADGKLVTGTIEDGVMWHYHYNGGVSAYEEDGAICFDHDFDKDVLYRKGEHIILCHSDLGDALPQEVVKGRTFTTSKGVKIEGAMEPGSGGSTTAGVAYFTLESDASTAGTFVKLGNVPWIAEHINEASLYVNLIRMNTTTVSDSSIFSVMSSNTRNINGNYSVSLYKSTYITSVGVSTSPFNNTTSTGAIRLCGDSNGDVYIAAHTNSFFAAGNYAMLYGLI